MKRFLWYRDPLFVGAFCLYLLNKFVIKSWPDHPRFFDAYLNDLICISLFVPPMVALLDVMRMRLRSGEPPNAMEILFPALIWGVMFEIYFPQHEFWSQYTYGDPFDMLCYLVGGCVSYLFWVNLYRKTDHPNAHSSTEA